MLEKNSEHIEPRAFENPDGNFPAASIARQTISGQLVRMDGHGVLIGLANKFVMDMHSEK